MSSDSSDEDIPGLHYVSGSDIVDDSEDNSEYEQFTDDTNSYHCYENAKIWFMLDRPLLSEHVEVIRVYVLCPLLYGHAHQSDHWLRWCTEVGILSSDIEFSLDSLTEEEEMAVTVLVKASRHMATCLTADPDSGGEGYMDNLVRLLQVVEEVNRQASVEQAVMVARRMCWFRILIDEFFKSKGSSSNHEWHNRLFDRKNFVEIGCLFVFNQAYDHVMKIVNKKGDILNDFRKNFQLLEESVEEMREEGEKEMKRGLYDEAIDTFKTAIIYCPYHYKLYISRAHAFMQIQDYRASVSDGLRAKLLKPSVAQGHVCYIQALDAAGHKNRVDLASEDYYKCFPKERMKLKKALEQLRGLDKEIRKPSEKDVLMNEKIVSTCKQASDAYLAGNLDEALYYYEEALIISSENKTWQLCWISLECERFLVSLHWALGMAYLKKGSSEDAEKALSHFNTIVDYPSCSSFPPAYYGIGRALVMLHRHAEALDSVKQGIGLLSSYHFVALTWPGTSVEIEECHPQDTETRLQQLQQHCEPVHLADVICRYLNCLNHHTSADIFFKRKEYKGHIEIQCLDNCCIGYHTSCWRRFKGEHVVGGDKDFLGMSCPTPDCEGLIRVITIYDSKNKIKIKLEMDSSKKASLTAGIITAKESKRSSQQKHKKKSGVPLDSVASADGRPTRNAGTTSVPEEVSKEKPSSKEASKERHETIKEKEELMGVGMEEDLRLGEDALTTIPKELDGKDAGRSRSKRTKGHGREKPNVLAEHWNDLFVLPERTAAKMSPSSSDDDPILADPNTPFLPPEHLRSKIEEFESKEVPELGLAPRPPLAPKSVPLSTIVARSSKWPENSIPSSSAGGSGNSNSVAMETENLEFIRSYFGEIIRTHGPLDPNDPKILETMQFLPNGTLELIEKAGGIGEVLVNSGQFAIQDHFICPIEEVGVIAASISSSGASSTRFQDIANRLQTPRKAEKKGSSGRGTWTAQDEHQTESSSDGKNRKSGGGDHTSGDGDHMSAGVNHKTGGVNNKYGSDDHKSGVVDHKSGGDDHTSGGGDHTSGGFNHTSGGGDHKSGGDAHISGGFNHKSGGGDHKSGGGDHKSGGDDHISGGVNHKSGGGDSKSGGFNHKSRGVDHTSGGGDHKSGGDDHKSGGGDHKSGGDDHKSGAVNHKSGGGDKKPTKMTPVLAIGGCGAFGLFFQSPKSTGGEGGALEIQGWGTADLAKVLASHGSKMDKPKKVDTSEDPPLSGGSGSERTKEKGPSCSKPGSRDILCDKVTMKKTSSRDSSSISALANEGGAGTETKGQNKALGVRPEVLSSTNSSSVSGDISSSSSSMSSSCAALPEEISATQKKVKIQNANSKKPSTPKPDSSGGKANKKKVVASSREVPMGTVGVQTEPPLVIDKWVMTDPVQVVDSFKEQYERTLKDKKDLQEKLERSEDQKYMLQKGHKREMEAVMKKSRKDAEEEIEKKVQVVEGKLRSEATNVENVRKEGLEQLRSSKIEIKSLTEKIERMKKDLTKRDQQVEVKEQQMESDIDQLKEEGRGHEECMRTMKDSESKALARARKAEVELWSIHHDQVLKPLEQKMKEMEILCGNVPQGSELLCECLSYRDKLRTALTVYQSSTEEQRHMLKAGRELASLEHTLPPQVPLPRQLAMLMMRPGFFPMVPAIPRAPFPPVGRMMDPYMMMMMRPRAPGTGIGGVVGSFHNNSARNNVALASTPASGVVSTMHGVQGVPTPTGVSLPGFPAGDMHNLVKQSSSESPVNAEFYNGGGGEDGGRREERTEGDERGGSGSKKSSFDRVVERLTPAYSNYSREDFKGFLHEVRRKNNNILSGLSVESIVQQVKALIEQQEKKSSRGGGVAGDRGKSGGTHPDAKAGKKHGAPSPRNSALAQATPLLTSSANYNMEGSCIICYDDMADGPSRRLDCGHTFHSECIRSWFKEQSTCPTCRNHSLLMEDYPSLK